MKNLLQMVWFKELEANPDKRGKQLLKLVLTSESRRKRERHPILSESVGG